LDGVLTCEIKNNGGPDYDIFTLSENLTGYLKDLNQIDGKYEYTLERR
jgi:hypothetical protein